MYIHVCSHGWKATFFFHLYPGLQSHWPPVATESLQAHANLWAFSLSVRSSYRSVICSYLVFHVKTILLGTGEMAQWVETLDALAEDPSSIPRPHMVAHNHL